MPPPRYHRTDRVAALILREVTRIVREEVRDPRIGFVTFTGAEVSPDLSVGRVYVSVMGTEDERRDSLAGLQSAARFIRNQLWRLLDLKTVPEIRFELDRTLERAARIEAVLEQVHAAESTAEGELAGAGDSPAEAAPPPGREEEQRRDAGAGGGDAAGP